MTTIRTLAVDGAQIAYSDSGGPGDVVLLVHAGVFADWFAPLTAEPALAGFRLVRMVRAGYTAGRPPTRHLTVADHAGHCAALLDALDVPRAHVVAHSSGSVIALQLAVDRPDLVAGLVLGEPPLIDSLAAPEDVDVLHAAVGPAVGAAMAAAAAGDLPAAFARFMTAVCGPEHRAVLTAALGAEGLARAERDSGFFFADEARAAAEWTFDDATAAGVRCPALVVQGGDSPPVVHRLVARLATRLPAAEVATVPGDDHLLPLRSPTALGRLVARFANELRPATMRT
jgi:pimeloyl-ACP methyl ester carboxylesterase